MAHLAIMRAKKLKGSASLNGAVAHIARARETPNADADRRALNAPLVGDDNAKAIRAGIADRTPERYRKDAVRAFEFVLTASPEFFKDNGEQTGHDYLASAVDWLKNEFGEANVVSAVIHHDETSPHVHVIAVPLVEETGKLSAKRFVDGKADMSRMQTRFADWQASFGVERGVERVQTQRDHTTIAEWQAGHSQLDERENDLKEREEKAALQLQEAERLNAETKALSSDLEQREEKVAAKEKKLEAWEKKATGWYQEHVEKFKSERSSITARTASLDDREKHLSAKEQKASVAEKSLTARSAALDDREKRLSALESRVSAFVESQRPRELTAAEKASLRFAAMPASQRIDAMSEYGMENPQMRDAISALGWVSYDTGEVTKAGAAALERYGGVQQQEARQEAWQARDLPAPDGPGM